MQKSNIFLYFILATIIFLSACDSGNHSFTGRILDSETGYPVKATVSLRDGDGLDLEPDGTHEFVYYLGKKRWYVDGEFSVSTGEDSLFIEIRRGLETYPVIEKIILTGSASEIHEFKLKRWTDMESGGYLSGDSHVHFLTTESAFFQMQAEDLHVVNLLTSDFTADAHKFSGSMDTVSTDEYFIYVGQEFRDWQMGHVNLLDLKEIVEPLEPNGGFLALETPQPNLLLSPRLREARAQGATTLWAHFSNLPGIESVIAFTSGLVDAVELMTYDDPTQLPSHWTPWDYSGMSQAEFPALRGTDLYYQYLNIGCRLPIAAGTDKMGDNIPVGSNRLYVRFDGEKSYNSWIKGLKEGRGFITNGPMLTFSVDGHQSGETVEYNGNRTVKVKLKAESLLPFEKIEIIANGKLVAWKYLENYWEKADLYSDVLEVKIELSESTWIVGRAVTVDAPGILPRDLHVFAHTNPVYLIKDKKPVFEKTSAGYLLTYIKASRNWIGKFSDFTSDTEKKEALDLLFTAETALKNDANKHH